MTDSVKGFPPPRVTWLRARGRTSNDYQPLLDGSDGRLTILPNGSLWTASAGPQDEGHYLCRANNGIGSGLSKVIYVSVHGTWFGDLRHRPRGELVCCRNAGRFGGDTLTVAVNRDRYAQDL